MTLDGQQIVSVNQNRLKIWDLATGTEVVTLEGHSDKVNAAILTPDGHQIVSASEDTTLKVWNVGTWAEAYTLTGHTGPVKAVTVTSDGQWVVSASSDRTLRAWDLATGTEVGTLTKLTGAIQELEATPKGRGILFTTCPDGGRKVWASGKVINAPPKSTSRAKGARLSRNLVAATTGNAKLSVLDFQSRRFIARFSAEGSLTALTTDYNETIIAGDAWGCVHILKLMESC
jgi:WD40 repeat protein